MTWQIITADCLEAMAEMEEASVDAIVTDPPYGLEFMGKEWDRLGDVRQPGDPTFHKSGVGPFDRATVRYGYDVDLHAIQDWHYRWAIQALRVLKPGGHLLAFGGTRTYHRLACAVEDAGFEIRDCLAWMYGSGFPKSLDVSKAIDKAAGAEREVVGENPNRRPNSQPTYSLDGEARNFAVDVQPLTAPATPEAQRWQGWGTALKPAFEPVVLARKPLVGSVAQNVQAYGTGALNIDGTRIESEGYAYPNGPKGNVTATSYHLPRREEPVESHPAGRWPANVVLDPEAAALLDEQTGELKSPASYVRGAEVENHVYGRYGSPERMEGYGDTGGASRFFYCPKADREERDRGLEHRRTETPRSVGYGGMPTPRCRVCGNRTLVGAGEGDRRPNCGHDDWEWTDQAAPGWRGSKADGGPEGQARNPHPTVKPVELMRWLCKLVTPPGGLVLDPFAGSGSTGIAALREGFDFVGIEREADYAEIARDRIIGDAPLFNVGAEVPKEEVRG